MSRRVAYSRLSFDRPGRAVTLASPPWQSAHPSTTADDLCIEAASLLVWQLWQPALAACASSGVSACFTGGAA